MVNYAVLCGVKLPNNAIVHDSPQSILKNGVNDFAKHPCGARRWNFKVR